MQLQNGDDDHLYDVDGDADHVYNVDGGHLGDPDDAQRVDSTRFRGLIRRSPPLSLGERILATS